MRRTWLIPAILAVTALVVAWVTRPRPDPAVGDFPVVPRWHLAYVEPPSPPSPVHPATRPATPAPTPEPSPAPSPPAAPAGEDRAYEPLRPDDPVAADYAEFATVVGDLVEVLGEPWFGDCDADLFCSVQWDLSDPAERDSFFFALEQWNDEDDWAVQKFGHAVPVEDRWWLTLGAHLSPSDADLFELDAVNLECGTHDELEEFEPKLFNPLP